jgi:hypothetical protein
MASNRRAGTKRKKGVTVHEIPADPGPSGGYIETHTEYGRTEEGLTATTSSINIPLSPSKPRTSKHIPEPTPPPMSALQTFEYDTDTPIHEPLGPYDVLWVHNDSDEEEGGQEPEDARKRKRRKMVEVRTGPTVPCFMR